MKWVRITCQCDRWTKVQDGWYGAIVAIWVGWNLNEDGSWTCPVCMGEPVLDLSEEQPDG
jgi:hypothetical protein